METKTVTNIVPVTVNRKVKTRTVILTEKEALLLRDILGGSSTRVLANYAEGSFNYSKITDLETAMEDIENLSEAFTKFAVEATGRK